MKGLKKFPGHRRSPPGLEWTILKRLPWLMLIGTLVPLIVVLAAYLFPPDEPLFVISKRLTTIRIAAIATVVALWVSLFTVAIGCAFVWILKGPAYVADSYDIPDADKPAP